MTHSTDKFKSGDRVRLVSRNYHTQYGTELTVNKSSVIFFRTSSAREEKYYVVSQINKVEQPYFKAWETDLELLEFNDGLDNWV